MNDMVEQLRQHRPYILMFLLNLAVLIGVIFLLRLPEPRVINITTPAPPLTPLESHIQVQVSGAIVQPGVYTLTLGSRVSNALEAAGGARPDADLGQLNLALKLNDGDTIVVPARDATTESEILATATIAGAAPPKTPPSKININTASIEELDTLPRIGKALAQRIVDYRANQGPFKGIEDIKNVKGIGDALFENLKDLITVE
jgi:competence protein ComEA